MTSFFGQRDTGIVFAADLTAEDEACRILDGVAASVDVVKVGSPLVYGAGMGVVRRLWTRFGKPVFADLKVADVPHTNAKIIAEVAANDGAAVMVHGIIGPDGIEAAMAAADGQVGIIVQLELTNPGGVMFTQPIANDMAALASELGVFGTQAPGNRPDRVAEIRGILGAAPVIVCCGVGRQGGTVDEVLAAGGSYAIVGRSIYEAGDPSRAARELARVGRACLAAHNEEAAG